MKEGSVKKKIGINILWSVFFCPGWPAHSYSIYCNGRRGFLTYLNKIFVYLREKVGQLEEEEKDRQAHSFQLKVEVDPEYHPKIIGKRGAVITKIREKHDVNIQFPTQR